MNNNDDFYAVDTRNVTKTFGDLTAVNDVSIRIPCGEITALLGPNGAGKTTLIDLILGLQPPDSGSSSLFDDSPRYAIRRGLVGTIFQTGALDGNATVIDTVKLFASTFPSHLPVDEVMDRADLTGLAKRKTRKLSGGEQQRVRLALALLPDPELLILDEPTAGMDTVARKEFWKLMQEQAGKGHSMIFATHYLAEAQDFSQRVLILKEGRIIFDQPTTKLSEIDKMRTIQVRVTPESAQAVASQLNAILHQHGMTPGAGNERSGANNASFSLNDSGDEFTIQTQDPEPIAQAMLAIPQCSDLRINAPKLDDIYSELVE